jgi:hypothetical protein
LLSRSNKNIPSEERYRTLKLISVCLNPVEIRVNSQALKSPFFSRLYNYTAPDWVKLPVQEQKDLFKKEPKREAVK